MKAQRTISGTQQHRTRNVIGAISGLLPIRQLLQEDRQIVGCGADGVARVHARSEFARYRRKFAPFPRRVRAMNAQGACKCLF